MHQSDHNLGSIRTIRFNFGFIRNQTAIKFLYVLTKLKQSGHEKLRWVFWSFITVSLMKQLSCREDNRSFDNKSCQKIKPPAWFSFKLREIVLDEYRLSSFQPWISIAASLCKLVQVSRFATLDIFCRKTKPWRNLKLKHCNIPKCNISMCSCEGY